MLLGNAEIAEQIKSMLERARITHAQMLEQKTRLDSELAKLEQFIELQTKALKVVAATNRPTVKVDGTSVAKHLLDIIERTEVGMRATWLIDMMRQELPYLSDSDLKAQCYNALRRLTKADKVRKLRRGFYIKRTLETDYEASPENGHLRDQPELVEVR